MHINEKGTIVFIFTKKNPRNTFTIMINVKINDIGLAHEKKTFRIFRQLFQNYAPILVL